MTRKTPVSVLFVCMGNICRSPSAEGVFTHLVEQAGLRDRFKIDSAGTHDYHIGDPPDARSLQHALKRGYDFAHLRGRQVSREDFIKFDYILAMDEENLANMHRICPPEYHNKVQLFLDYAPTQKLKSVPDPYYGGARGFEEVLDLVEAASEGLLEHIQQEKL